MNERNDVDADLMMLKKRARFFSYVDISSFSASRYSS